MAIRSSRELKIRLTTRPRLRRYAPANSGHAHRTVLRTAEQYRMLADRMDEAGMGVIDKIVEDYDPFEFATDAA
jgi:hypothetical protein